MNSPAAKILGATPEARQLVKRSRKQLEEAKRRQAEELEEARQRAEEQERLHKAESERVKLLLEKRKRDRIFGVTVLLLGITMLVVIAASWLRSRLRVKPEAEALETNGRRPGGTASDTGREGSKSQRKRKVSFS